MTIRCSTCGKAHDDELPDIGVHAPDPYLAVPEDERPRRTTFTPDRCTVRTGNDVDYFIRGVLPIPIVGQSDAFGIGLWVSQSRLNYERYERNAAMTLAFGWIANRLPHYAQDTFGLKARVCFHDGGLRPTLELEVTEHPLAIDQRTGITLERAWQIVHRHLLN